MTGASATRRSPGKRASIPQSGVLPVPIEIRATRSRGFQAAGAGHREPAGIGGSPVAFARYAWPCLRCVDGRASRVRLARFGQARVRDPDAVHRSPRRHTDPRSGGATNRAWLNAIGMPKCLVFDAIPIDTGNGTGISMVSPAFRELLRWRHPLVTSGSPPVSGGTHPSPRPA